MSTNPKVHTECSLRCSYWLILDKRFHDENTMLACSIYMGNLKRNKTKWYFFVNLENKNTFFIIYSNLLLSNLQKRQIILTHPGLMRRVFTNCPRDRSSISDWVILKTQKMVLDVTLHCKVRIKGNVEQFREWSSALPYTSVLKLLKREPSSHPWQRSATLIRHTVVDNIQ